MKSINLKIVITVLTIVILALAIIVRFVTTNRDAILPTNNDSTNPNVNATPTTVPIIGSQDQPAFLEAVDIPVGTRGVNLQDPLVKESQTEIQRLLRFLPYTNTLTTQSGVTVDIIISDIVTEEHPWYVSVDMYGIDFEVDPNSQDGVIMKNAFLESVNSVTTWMKENNIDPSKIYIEWGGDQAETQAQAAEWLNEQ